MTIKVENLPFFGKPDGYLLKALFKSAANLEDKAQVKVAGVEAGKVEALNWWGKGPG